MPGLGERWVVEGLYRGRDGVRRGVELLIGVGVAVGVNFLGVRVWVVVVLGGIGRGGDCRSGGS